MSSEKNEVPAVLEFDPSLLPTYTGKLTQTQLGWLGLEFIKTNTFTALGKSELEIQQEVAKVMAKPYTNVDLTVMLGRQKEVVEIIKSVKAKWGVMEGQRKFLTGTLTDGIIKPAMEFEKRAEAEIAKADTHEFQMRKAIEVETNKTQALTNEKALYKAHIENEVNRIRITYGTTLQKLAMDSYKILLEDKEPVANFPRFKKNLAELMNATKLEPSKIYNRVLVTDDIAQAIIAEIEMYDPADDLKKAIASIDNVFAMYAEDLANSTAAIARIEETKATVSNAATDLINQEAAINTLTAKAGTFQFEGGPKVRRKMDVVVENSDAWAMALIGNFTRLFNDVRKYISVKEWEKLTLKQMATALGKYATETGDTFSNLQLREVEK